MQYLRRIEEGVDMISLWIMRATCLGALSAMVMLARPETDATVFWTAAIVVSAAAVVGLGASAVRRPAAMRLLVVCFLLLFLAFWLSLDLVVLRVKWWEWPIAAVTQMGLPLVLAWYALRSPRFRAHFCA